MLTHTHTQTSKKKRGKSPQDNVVNVKSVKKKRSSPPLVFSLFYFSFPLSESTQPPTIYLFLISSNLFSTFFFSLLHLSTISLSLFLSFFSLSLLKIPWKNPIPLWHDPLDIQTDWKPSIVHAIINMLVCLIIFKLLNSVDFIYSIWNCPLNYWFIVHGLILFSDFLFASVCVCDWTFII